MEVNTARRMMWHTIASSTEPQASNVKEGQSPSNFIVLYVEEQNENPDDISASKAFVKVLFDTTHSLAFRKLVEAKKNGRIPRVYGSFHSMSVNPYYPKDKQGKYFLDANGKPRIAHRVTFFLLADEDVMTALRQACRNLEWVEITNEGTDSEASKAAKLAGTDVQALIDAEAAKLAGTVTP
jgi:hypothetical protein